MHLSKGAIRELHWHSVVSHYDLSNPLKWYNELIICQSEWGYVLAGSLRVAAVDEEGKNQIDTVDKGDIWYFPKGSPHTIQGFLNLQKHRLDHFS